LKQRAYERRLAEDGTLRRRAWGLVVSGAGCLLIGLVSHDAFTLTVGVFALGAGGIWRPVPHLIHDPVLSVAFRCGAVVMDAAGDLSGWDFAMRDTRGWSDIVFQMSVAIIVVEFGAFDIIGMGFCAAGSNPPCLALLMSAVAGGVFS